MVASHNAGLASSDCPATFAAERPCFPCAMSTQLIHSNRSTPETRDQNARTTKVTHKGESIERSSTSMVSP
eukprot:3888010-Amphidinium_carterae.3